MAIQYSSILSDSNSIFKSEDDFISSKHSYSLEYNTFGFMCVENGINIHELSESSCIIAKFVSYPDLQFIK